MMKWCNGLLIVMVFAIMVPLGGCCGGTNEKVIEKQPIIETSLGDELLKLNEAREKGVITDQEFETAKAKLLKAE